jgi:hypothetical protein
MTNLLQTSHLHQSLLQHELQLVIDVVTCDMLTYVIVISTGNVVRKISNLDHKNVNHLSLIQL